MAAPQILCRSGSFPWRPAAAAGGRHGKEPDTHGPVFAVELAEAAKGVLMGLAGGPQGPPLKVRAIFAHGIAPGEVADAAVPGYVHEAGLAVLAEGEQPLLTTEFTAEGERIEVPSKWLVAGREG